VGFEGSGSCESYCLISLDWQLLLRKSDVQSSRHVSMLSVDVNPSIEFSSQLTKETLVFDTRSKYNSKVLTKRCSQ
jgi:hypothetical protein